MSQSSYQGRDIAGYHIIRRLGRSTFEAKRNRQHFALKLINASVALQPTERARLQREIEVLRQVQQHEYIISIEDVIEYDDTTILVMPYKADGTLRGIIDNKRLSVEAKLSMLQQVAYAVDFLHRRNIWHRDLKPENVLIERDSNKRLHPYLTDFGIAYLEHASRLTRTGMWVGTPEYMAPEMWDTTFGAIDHRIDIYALGVMAYEIVVGQRPFSGQTDMQIMSAHCHKPIPEAELRASTNNLELENVILSALQKSPAHRIGSAAEFGDQLLKAHVSGTFQRQHQKVQSRRERLNLWIAVIALILGVLGTVFGYIEITQGTIGGDDDDENTVAVILPDADDGQNSSQDNAESSGTNPDNSASESQPNDEPPPETNPDTSAENENSTNPSASANTESNSPVSESSGNSPNPNNTAAIAQDPSSPLNEALLLAERGVSENSDWEPVTASFGGVRMALVPTGCFEMGTDGSGDESPAHNQCIRQAFWMDVYEVTNAQYGGANQLAVCTSRSIEDEQPRVCVDWFEAKAYCEARGARLPTEAEWEYAARGPDSLRYPWGERWVANNAAWRDNAGATTQAVGTFLPGTSWVGTMDLAGNVWEWTNSLFEPYPYDPEDGREANTGERVTVLRVLRGGSYKDTSVHLHASNRFSASPDVLYNDVGFRCVRAIE